MANKDTRKPTMSELITQHERERNQALQESLKRALAAETKRWEERYQKYLKKTKGSELATPSPDDMPADYNATPKENDYE